MSESRFNLKLVTALVFTLFTWSSAYAAIHVCLHDGGFLPGHLALFRFIVASVTMAVICAVARIPLPAWRDIPQFLVLGFFGVVLTHLGLYAGQQTVESGTASFLFNLTPLFAMLLATIILKEKMTWLGWFGVMLCLAGMLVITLAESNGWRLNKGALLIMLSASASAIGLVLNKNMLKKYDALQVAAAIIFAGTFLLLLFSPGLLFKLQHAPKDVIVSGIYLGVFPTALTYLTWAYVLSRLPASQTASFLYVMPLLAIAIAWLWLGEIPDVVIVLGGLLTILGITITNMTAKLVNNEALRSRPPTS